MSPEEMLLELWHREMIRDCLYRYCRGIDRADEVLIRSAYWPDGTDSHGSYKGSAEGFIDWAVKSLPRIERGIHQIHNVLIQLHGQQAVVEAYFTARQRQPNASGQVVDVHMAGRYVDRFERRGDEWRVADRIVVFDWLEERAPQAGTEAERFASRTPIGSRWPDDPVYQLLPGTRRQTGRAPRSG